MNRLRRALSWLGLGVATSLSTGGTFSAAVAIDATSDAPIGFGYKTNWFAIRTTDLALVAQTLGLTDVRPSNWASGIAAAYAHGAAQSDAGTLVFVSPAIDGWTFLVGSSLPYPDERRQPVRREIGLRFTRVFSKLASRFAEVQFFGSYRVVGFDAWARARNGRIERIFSFADGEVLANVGEQTLEERSLRFLDLTGLSRTEATTAIFENAEKRNELEEQLVRNGLPRRSAQEQISREQRDPIPNEEHTMAIAGAWSLDPTQIEKRNHPRGVGVVASLRGAVS